MKAESVLIFSFFFVCAVVNNCSTAAPGPPLHQQHAPQLAWTGVGELISLAFRALVCKM